MVASPIGVGGRERSERFVSDEMEDGGEREAGDREAALSVSDGEMVK
jgi:hypothetical protein